MSYMGGQHVVACLDAHYARNRIEAGVWITCQKCGHEQKLDVPHSLSDLLLVKKFRKLGWKCTDSGKRARCPKCVGVVKS